MFEAKMIVQIYEVQTPDEAFAMAALGVDHIGSVVVAADMWRQPLIRDTIRAVASSGARSSLILLYNDADLVSRSIDYYHPDIVHFCEMIVPGNDISILEKTCATLFGLQATVRKRFPEISIMRSIPIPAARAVAGIDGGYDGNGINNPGDRHDGDVGGEADAAAAAGVQFLAGLFAPVSDYFLTDTLLIGRDGTLDQPVDGFVGITGRTCDWGIAAELVRTSPIPVILAGGLSPENVYEGATCVEPAGVDSCTLTNAVDPVGRPIRFRKDAEKVRRFIAEARRARQSF